MARHGTSGGILLALLKVLGLLVALVGMVGFGLCGLFGLGLGAFSDGFDLQILMLGVLGLFLSVGFLMLFRWILRSGNREPS